MQSNINLRKFSMPTKPTPGKSAYSPALCQIKSAIAKLPLLSRCHIKLKKAESAWFKRISIRRLSYKGRSSSYEYSFSLPLSLYPSHPGSVVLSSLIILTRCWLVQMDSSTCTSQLYPMRRRPVHVHRRLVFTSRFQQCFYCNGVEPCAGTAAPPPKMCGRHRRLLLIGAPPPIICRRVVDAIVAAQFFVAIFDDYTKIKKVIRKF